MSEKKTIHLKVSPEVHRALVQAAHRRGSTITGFLLTAAAVADEGVALARQKEWER